MPRLLLVEDQEPILFALQDYLSTYNFHVDTARNPREARSCLQSRHYDILLGDLCLTGNDPREGLDVLRLARRTGRPRACNGEKGHVRKGACH